MLINRLETEGPWVKFKKPLLSSMPIPDFASLSQSKLKILSNEYDRLKGLTLSPLQLIDNDPVRFEIDKAVIRAFGLSDVSIIREMLAREPMISLKRL